jgi:beta-lactamase regulating signal transducer with metallopeptidase domain
MIASALLDQLVALPPIGRAIVVSTILIGAAGVGAAVAWRAAASLRHALWLVAIGGAIGAAVLSFAGPTVRFDMSAVPRQPRPVVYNVTNFGTSIPVPQGFASAPSPGPQAATATSPRTYAPALGTLLIALWAFGAFIVVARSIAGHVGIYWLTRSTRELPLADVLASVIAEEMDVPAPVVRVSDVVDGPFTIGMHGAVVLLPAEAEAWSTDRLRVVLLHELAHVSRFDYVSQLVATIACALYWFNPAVWIAAARLRAEAEQAADDRVLEAGIDGVTYATHLLELAGRVGAPRLSTAVAVGMARSNRLERRFQSMLDNNRSRGNTPIRHQVFATVAVVAMLVPVVGFKAVTTPPSAASIPHLAPVTVTAATLTTRIPTLGTKAPPSDSLIEQTLNASAGERISLDIPTGAEVYVQAWDQSQVRMKTLLSGTEVPWTRVSFIRVNGGLELRFTLDRSTSNSSNSNRVELWVPRKFDLQFSSGGGGIHIDGVEGRFTGRTGGGDITIRNAKGMASLTTGGGQINLSGDDLNGEILTGGGNAVLNSVTGDVHVGSGGGTIVRDGTQIGGSGYGGSYSYGSGQRGSSRAGSGYGYGYSTNGSSTVWSSSSATAIGGQYSGTSVSIGGGPIDLSSAPNGGSYSTGGGDIHVGASAGMLAVTTGGGDIRLDQVAGDAVATTGAGMVEISVVNANGSAHSVSVASGSGKVIIDLPANIDARFDLESAYTENHGPTAIRSDFQVNQTESQDWDASHGTPRKYIRANASFGSGRGLIRVRTVNGDVVIRRR